MRRASRPKRPEREIQHAILEYLRILPNVWAWRNNTGAMILQHKGTARMVRFGAPGLSDVLGWVSVAHERNGQPARIARFLAIEVKTLGQYPTPAQAAFLDAVARAGGVAIVARSVEDVRRVLEDEEWLERGT